MAFSSVLQMYLGWANSVLHEDEDIIDGFHQLRDGQVFCQLIDILTGSALRQQVNSLDQNAEDTVQTVLDFLQEKGVQVKTRTKAIVSGELKGILDIMWALILHFTVHSEDRAAYQRTVWIGKKMLLQWCMDELPNAELQTNKSLALNFQDNNYLAKLIYKHCSYSDYVEGGEDKYVSNLTNAVLAAEDKFGIKKSFISPADVINGNTDDHALLLYLALLHRKVNQTMPLSNRSQNTLPFTSEEEESPTEDDDIIRSKVEGEANEETKIEGSKSLQGYLQSLEELKNEATHLDTTEERGNSTITSLTSISTVQELDTDSGVSPSDKSPISPPDKSPIRHSTPAVPEEDQDTTVSQQDLNDARKQLVETLLAVDAFQTSDFNSSDSKAEEQDRISPSKIFRLNQSGTGDELLDVLEAIGKECNQLREELAESAKRELSLQRELQNCSVSGKASPEDKVIGKLVQELEILRAENRRLFRETANAKSSNSSDRRSIEGLKKTVQKLRTELEQVNSENFALKFKQRLREVHDESGSQDFDKSGHFASPNKLNGDQDNDMASFHIDGLPDTTNVRELKQHIASAKYESKILRDKLDTTNTDMTAKLNQTYEDLKTTKEESQKVEQENRLLKMAAETNKSEIESMKVKIDHLQKALLDAEERNNKQTNELEELRRIIGPDSNEQQLKRENAILREKLQIAEEDRDILRHELKNYRTTQSILESSLSYREKSAGDYDNEPLETVAREPVARKHNDEIVRSSYQDPTPNLPLKNPRHERNLDHMGHSVSMETVSRKLQDIEAQRRNRAPSPWEYHSSSDRHESSRKHGHGRRHTVSDPVAMETRKQEESTASIRGRSQKQSRPSGAEVSTRQSVRTRSLSPAVNRHGEVQRGQRSQSMEQIDFTQQSKVRSGHRGHSSERSRSRSKDAKQSSGKKEGRRHKDPSPRRSEKDGRRRHGDRVDGYDDALLVNGDVGDFENDYDDDESDGLSERSFRPEDFVNEFAGSRTDRSEKRREVEHWLKEEVPAAENYSHSDIMYGKLPKVEEPTGMDNFIDYSTAGGDFINDIAFGQLPYTHIHLDHKKPAAKTANVSGTTRDRRHRSRHTVERSSHREPAVTREKSYTVPTSYSSSKPLKTENYTSSSRRYTAPSKTTDIITPSYDSYSRNIDVPKQETKPSYSVVPMYSMSRTYSKPTHTTTTAATSTTARSHQAPTTYSSQDLHPSTIVPKSHNTYASQDLHPTTNVPKVHDTYSSQAYKPSSHVPTTHDTYSSNALHPSTNIPTAHNTYSTPELQTSSHVPTTAGKPRYDHKYEIQTEAPPAPTDLAPKYNGYGYSPPERLTKDRESPVSGRIRFGQLPRDPTPPLINGHGVYLSSYIPDPIPLKPSYESKISGERHYSSQLPPRAPPKINVHSPVKSSSLHLSNGDDIGIYSYKKMLTPEKPGKVMPESPSKTSVVGSEFSSNGPLSLSELQSSPNTGLVKNNYSSSTPALHLNDDDANLSSTFGNHSYKSNLPGQSSNSMSKLDDPAFSSTHLSNLESSTLKPTHLESSNHKPTYLELSQHKPTTYSSPYEYTKTELSNPVPSLKIHSHAENGKLDNFESDNRKQPPTATTTYSSSYSTSKPVSGLKINTSSENAYIPPPPLSPSNLQTENSGTALMDKFRNVSLTPEQEKYANSLIDKYMSSLGATM